MKLLSTIILGIGLLMSVGANALELDKANSSLSYLSVKKNAVAEIGYFKEFTVVIDEAGNFNLNIDLSSIESGIEVRNHRLRTFLFEIIRFPTAKIFGQLNPDFYKNLKPGQYVHQNLKAIIALHGMQKQLSVAVRIIALADGTLNVSSSQSVLLNANDFRLTKGIKKLAELAKLNAINSVVPVSFNFSFKK